MGIVFRNPDEEGLARYISDVTADGAAWDEDGDSLHSKLDATGMNSTVVDDLATDDTQTGSGTEADDQRPQA